MLFFFPRGVLDEILNLIESVSEGFPSYFCFEDTVISITIQMIETNFLVDQRFTDKSRRQKCAVFRSCCQLGAKHICKYAYSICKICLIKLCTCGFAQIILNVLLLLLIVIIIVNFTLFLVTNMKRQPAFLRL